MEIDKVLILLSNFLEKLFNLKKVSFTLFKAKIDATGSCIDEMWNLLHHFTTCGKMSCELGNAKLCVKAFLLFHGYKKISFFNFSKENNFGSQELLFALSWIISKRGLENCLKRIISSLLKQIGESYNVFPEETMSLRNGKCPFFTKEMESDSQSVNTINSKNTIQEIFRKKPFDKCMVGDKDICLSLIDYMNHLILTAGKLKHMIRINKTLLKERNQTSFEIHQSTFGELGIPFYYDEEVATLCRTVIKDDGACGFEEVIDVIDTYISWENESHIFFYWMETIIDEACRKSRFLPKEAELNDVDTVLLALLSDSSLLNKNCLPSMIENLDIFENFILNFNENKYNDIYYPWMQNIIKGIEAYAMD